MNRNRVYRKVDVLSQVLWNPPFFITKMIQTIEYRLYLRLLGGITTIIIMYFVRIYYH